MWHRRLSRRQLLALSGAAFAAKFLGGARAQSQPIRIGVVLPTKTGLTPIRAATHQMAGEAARMGAIMAEEEYGFSDALLGKHFEVLISTAPNDEAALRAAQRLAAAEEVFALIGGFGEEQAHILSQVAEAHQILFFNIGSPSDALRGQGCRKYTFHVEASAAMYLDALVDWYVRSGFHRWFLVHEDSSEGETLYQRAVWALKECPSGGNEVGKIALNPDQQGLTEVLSAVREARPDVVLLLLNAVAQLDFLGQYEMSGLGFAVTGFPYPVTQTRTFFAASRSTAPKAGSGYRATLWEATLDAYGARELNERFSSRWGMPMDPPAWAAYTAVKILVDAVAATGFSEPQSLAAHLVAAGTEFEVHKGANVSFRDQDHQLLQPLYIVQLNTNAETPTELASPLAEVSGDGEANHRGQCE